MVRVSSTFPFTTTIPPLRRFEISTHSIFLWCQKLCCGILKLLFCNSWFYMCNSSKSLAKFLSCFAFFQVRKRTDMPVVQGLGEAGRPPIIWWRFDKPVLPAILKLKQNKVVTSQMHPCPGAHAWQRFWHTACSFLGITFLGAFPERDGSSCS